MGGAKSITHMYTYHEYLYYYINKNEIAKAEEVLQKKPELIRAAITPTSKVTPLIQTAFKNNIELAKLLIDKYEADPNLPSEKGETPLITAIRRNHLEMVRFLLQQGANPDYVDKAGFKTIEYAILQGLYEIAYLIDGQAKDRDLKPAEDYAEMGKKYQYRYVNYTIFLQELEKKVEPEKCRNFLKKQKIVLNDPVIDPRETWGQWICRNIEFKDPPLVQRAELPHELRPENRRFGKVSHFFGRMSLTPASQKPSFKPEVRSEMGEIHSKNFMMKENDEKDEIQTVN